MGAGWEVAVGEDHMCPCYEGIPEKITMHKRHEQHCSVLKLFTS